MHAFLWHKGLMTDLGTPVEEGDSYRAIAINDRGQVIITSDPGNRPFFWEKGVITDLGAQAPQGGRAQAGRCG